LRLAFKDIHSLYHALFIVGPVTNVLEIIADSRRVKVEGAVPATPVNV
jgi:hypothetical protein